MIYSRMGEQLTERFEGCRLVAYRDSAGVPTIGYGHTYGVYIGMTCSEYQAQNWLAQDITFAERAVDAMVRVPLTQGEFDALVDFVFNVGAYAFGHSTMLAKLNAGDYSGAAAEFEKWDYAGGVAVAGLLARREAERATFAAAVSE